MTFTFWLRVLWSEFFSDFCNMLLPFELLVFLQQISMVKFNLYTVRTKFTC